MGFLGQLKVNEVNAAKAAELDRLKQNERDYGLARKVADMKDQEAKVREMNAIAAAQRTASKGVQFDRYPASTISEDDVVSYINNGGSTQTTPIPQEVTDRYMRELMSRYPQTYTRE